MSFMRSIVFVSVSAIVGAFAYGCSSTTTTVTTPSEDAGRDVNRPVGDAASDGPVATACKPGDVSTFSAPAYKPAAAKAGACTPALIDSFFTNCLDEAAPQNGCATNFGSGASAANKACSACLITQDTAAKYGALVDHGDTVSVNIPGCMELKGNRTCAESVQKNDACQELACRANCPVTDNTTLRQYSQCQQQASAGGCKTYAEAETACSDASADGGAGNECWAWLSNTNAAFKDIYLTVAPIFCGGTAPSDGGTDSGAADAAAD